MMTLIKPACTFLLGCVLIVICGACQVPAQLSATSTPIQPTPAIAFPRIEMSVDYAAEMSGKLVLVGRCIRIVPKDDPQGYGVLWYSHFTFDGVLITDTRSKWDAKIGESVRLGGGGGGNSLGNIATNSADNPCEPPFWLASGISR